MKQIIRQIFHRMKEDSLARKITEVPRKKKYSSLSSIKRAVVLWTAGEKEKGWLKKIREGFPGVKWDKICFVPDGYQGSLSADTVYIQTGDLGFGGKITNERLLQVLENPYDLFIDLTEESNVLTDYVLKSSRAACKAGMPKENFEADIVMEGGNDPMVFLEELIKLLSNLKEY